MPEDEKTDGNGEQTPPISVPTSIALRPTSTIDLIGIPEEERKALMNRHAEGLLDIRKKAVELGVDALALENVLRTASETVRNASEQGTHTTVSHTQTSSIGRTEVIMGNTDRARAGKLSKSQTGETDWTPIYVIIGIVAAIIIAMIVAG